MATPRQRNAALGPFRDGVNNVAREDSLPPSALRKATNVDLLPGGKIRRRGGYTRRLALTDCRSATSHLGKIYLASGGDFLRVDPLTYETTVVASVNPNAFLSYDSLNEYLYVTDGHGALFRITPAGEVEDACPENPNHQPTCTSAALGNLPAGTYQVAAVFMRGTEESGTVRAAQVTLSDEQGIELTNLPVPQSAEVTAVRIYMSHTNGESLYHYADVPVGTTSYYIVGLPNGKLLETQFLEPLPIGHIVRAHNGRLFTAVGNYLFFSEALRFGLCHPTKNYVAFEDRITMVRPVESGVYVSAGKRTHFLRGEDPLQFVRANAHHASAIEGTDLLVQAGMFSFENLSTGYVAVWWASNGVMVVGLPNGQVQPLREGELSLPDFERGSVAIRERDGVQQLVSLLEEPKSNHGRLAVQDEVVATVYRNGIEV